MNATRFAVIDYRALRAAWLARHTGGRWVGKPCAVGAVYQPAPKARVGDGGRNVARVVR